MIDGTLLSIIVQQLFLFTSQKPTNFALANEACRMSPDNTQAIGRTMNTLVKHPQKKGESKMNLNATVKLLGDETNGISNSTGNPWRGRMVLLEWPNAAGYMNRAWCSLFNSKLEAFETQGIRTGDSVQAEIRFSTRTYRSGFNRTDLEIIEIKKTNI
jgi:hypothetical protein